VNDMYWRVVRHRSWGPSYSMPDTGVPPMTGFAGDGLTFTIFENPRRSASRNPISENPRRSASRDPISENPRRSASRDPISENPRRSASRDPISRNPRRSALRNRRPS
jgi:hypothetical protein